MAEFIKAAFTGIDKITDILNLGRLVFYTAAGFPPVLVLAMILRTVAIGPTQGYWAQLEVDLLHSLTHVEVWAGSMIAGFLVANMGFVRAINYLKSEPEDQIVDPQGFAYQYPRLRTGRPRWASAESDFDYAAWLISEYYRYLEITIYIPYGVLLALPLLSVYSLARILLAAEAPARLDACFFGLAFWTVAAALGWSVVWKSYWLPNVATPVYRAYVQASVQITQGVYEFSGAGAPAPAADPNPPAPVPSQNVPKKVVKS